MCIHAKTAKVVGMIAAHVQTTSFEVESNRRQSSLRLARMIGMTGRTEINPSGIAAEARKKFWVRTQMITNANRKP